MNDGANNGPKIIHYEDGIPIFDKLDEVQREQLEAKKRDEHYKHRQMALNSQMVFLTLLLVLCTLFTGGISAYQTHIAKLNADAAIANAAAARDQVAAAKEQVAVLQKQIDEMERSGADTHEAVVQAKRQAEQLKDLADRTLDQANATGDLVRETRRSADTAGAALSSQEQAIRAQTIQLSMDNLLGRFSGTSQPCKPY